jgi:hypothetical protein
VARFFHNRWLLFWASIGLALIVYVSYALFRCQTSEPPADLADLQAAVKNSVKRYDFDCANSIVLQANASAIAENEIRGSSANTVLFAAFSDFSIQIPGVAKSLETDLLSRRRFVEIPGTGDDVPFAVSLGSSLTYDAWQKNVEEFATQYNRAVIAFLEREKKNNQKGTQLID